MSEQSAVAFLAHILPQAGLRCATLFVGKRVTNHFFTSNVELARFIFGQDEIGNTVYHACASFQTSANRSKANAAFIRSLYADIDGGADAVAKGTGYERADIAVHALADFCHRAGLPIPTLVSSGSGLHAYWPFDRDLTVDEWLPLANGLKQRAREMGLLFDPARTADAASILRTPGTHNRKSGSTLVTLLHRSEQYPVESFARLLDGHQEAVQPVAQSQPAFGDASHLAYRKPSVASVSLVDLGGAAPRYGQLIADKCAQIRNLRDTRGLLPEPVWYACLALLAFTEDCYPLAHEWSKGDQRYNPHEVEKKLAQAHRLSGPTTCEKFADVNPQGCLGCPFRGTITSPIALGYSEVSQRPTDGAASCASAVQAGLPDNRLGAPGLALNGHHSLPNLPVPFAWQGESLVLQQGAQAGVKDTLVSRYPIYLASVNRSEVSGDFSLSFRQKIGAEPWTDHTVAGQDLFGPAGISGLSRFGANIHDGELFRKYVRVAIDQFYHDHPLRIRYDQYGWKKTGFLYGPTLYTNEGPETAAINKELSIRNQWVGPGAGSEAGAAAGLERWRNAANTLFAEGLEAQSAAVLAAFAAPLMRFIATNEGGAILSLVSAATGKNKSNALAGAYTVWGQRQGLSLTNYDNRITKQLTLAALGNLPLIHDEITSKDPVIVREFVENFCEGRDKMRADRSGQIRHSAATWQTIMITASNASLFDIMSAGKDPSQRAYRVFELEAHLPEHLREVVGEKLTKELEANAGFAAEVYVPYLLQVRDLLPVWVEEAVAKVRAAPGLSDPAYRFWTRLIAVIGVAGTIVRHLGILHISSNRIVKELVKQAVARAAGPSDIRGKTETWYLLELASFVAGMKPYTLALQGTYTRNVPMRPISEPRDRVLARYETGSKQFTVSQEAMRAFAVERGFPWTSWREALEHSGVMSRAKRCVLTAGTEIPGAQMHCFEINLGHELVDAESFAQKVVPIRPVAASPPRG